MRIAYRELELAHPQIWVSQKFNTSKMLNLSSKIWWRKGQIHLFADEPIQARGMQKTHAKD